MPHPYTIVSHTADTGITTHGETLAEAIGNAAFAMFDLMYDLSSVALDRSVTVTADASSAEDLLVDVLSGLLFVSETHDLVLGEFRVDEEALYATVTAAGSSSRAVELAGPPIKAITYHDLQCEPDRDGWAVRVIFDV